MPKCKNCQKEFNIDKEDDDFYQRVQVPPPTLCPDCRRQRRLAWRNDLTFYQRKCDLCGQDIISLYHPEKKLTVYCNRCWWSDKWEPRDYGQEIDFSRSFFEQFRDLQNKVPLIALVNDNGVQSINCEYTHNVTFAKNCYMGSMSWKNEDCLYYYHLAGPETREVVDSLDVFNYSQIIYDSIFLEHCYNCRSCYYSTDLVDCLFCYDCIGCSSCFMCINLRQQKYCILNKQYSPEEYKKVLESYKLDTFSGVEKARGKFLEFILKQPRRFANIRNCLNSTGDALFNCKNTRDSFLARACEDVKFFIRGNEVKDSYDLSTGGESSLCYEGLTADHDYLALFTIFSFKNQEVSYCENCHSSKYLFGCSAIKHGKHCILNKEYSAKDYIAVREKLIEQMKKTGEYGEFFPISLSHFGYNETMAQEYFPLSKDEALSRGYKWWDQPQITTKQETIQWAEIPDSIKDVADSILDEILVCNDCQRNYKIVPKELDFYREHSIPIPRSCFYCRNSKRFKFENPTKLWERVCNKCDKGISTTYAPDRKESVYCQECYQKEIY